MTLRTNLLTLLANLEDRPSTRPVVPKLKLIKGGYMKFDINTRVRIKCPIPGSDLFHEQPVEGLKVIDFTHNADTGKLYRLANVNTTRHEHCITWDKDNRFYWVKEEFIDHVPDLNLGYI